MHDLISIMIVLQVVWMRLYGRNSNRDGGTLLQLRNLLNRSSVPKDPKNNVNATDDFINVALEGHIIAAGMEVMGMSTINDQPDDFPHAQMRLSKDRKKQLLNNVTEAVVSKFVNLALLKEETQESGGSAGRRKGKKKKAKRKLQANEGEKDGVQEYAIEFLTMGLLHAEFCDAVKEGDGKRVLRCWKFFLLYFKASK